jgi:ATP-binding cassette subfamily F protein uup
MKNPNFLILDEPTNDLDIMTLNVLEEYLQNFRGCVIIVSHDRYFMDKVVGHLFVFEGKGVVRNFPGNYSLYRDYLRSKEREQRLLSKNKDSKQISKSSDSSITASKKKLSYKEQKELQQLEPDIKKLEEEYKALEASMYSGNLNVDEVTSSSIRMGEILKLIDTKTNRWIELSDLANNTD